MSWSDFPEDIRKVSPLLWSLSRRYRSRLNHGLEICDQRSDAFSFGYNDERLCPKCCEFHVELLCVAARRLDRAMSRGTSVDPVDFVKRHWKSWAADARDRLDASRGLAVRIDRLPNRQWFVAAVPDPVDQRIAIDILYFVRSGDSTGRHPFPLERLAERYGLALDDVATRFHRAFAGLRSKKRIWVENNFDRPMSERLVELSDEFDDRRCA